MGIYKSSDGQSFFSFSKTDSTNANGSVSYGFKIEASSWGSTSVLDNIWFYDEDLKNFSDALESLLIGKIKEACLEAMSECVVTICPIDNSGHFEAKIKMENPAHRNSAEICVELETQSLVELAQELRTLSTIK